MQGVLPTAGGNIVLEGGVSDALNAEARTQFSEAELVDLTFAVIAINAWNRLAVTFRPTVGSYKSAHAAAAPRAV